MKIYFFGGDFNLIERIYESNFDGTLLLYNARGGEMFTSICLNAKKIRPDFKYMVAVRPYVISPQYLSMINRSIKERLGNVLQINLVTGWIKEEEEPFNAFVGEISDKTPALERSNYLIKFLESMHTFKNNLTDKKHKIDKGHLINTIPDIYVSVSNHFTFNAASEHNDGKMIIHYSTYKDNCFIENEKKADLTGKRVFVSFGPVIRSTKEELEKVNITKKRPDHVLCTEQQLINILKEMKQNNIEGVLLFSWENEMENLFNFMKNNKHLI